MNDIVKTRLIPIRSWNKFHEWPKESGLRHLRFNSDKNGFRAAFVTVGSRVMVDERAFFRCVEKINS